jgi:hypothetical protein
MQPISKYSLGTGDRFARQARAQLRACMMAGEAGVEVTPVWNKSHREHVIVGSQPVETRRAADAAVRELGWRRPYFVDADHINLKNADGFIEACDFFTLDVAYAIGIAPAPAAVVTLLAKHVELARELTREAAADAACKYLFAAQEAGRIYRRIAAAKGAGTFITEVSLDETNSPQTPEELLVILAALADEGVPVQTIAPKFSGRFNKGVDYVGDVARFESEFRNDIAAIAHAIAAYGLPRELKLSVHSGSDKFSLYGPMHRVLVETGAGIHLKTAGTTWLEEVIGLAESGGEGLAIAKEIYTAARGQMDDLCAPYASVIDIDAARLPEASEVAGWTAERFAAALRHDPACPDFNPHFRQLLHVGYKIAAKLGERFFRALEESKALVSRNVTFNLYERHLKPLFL